LYIEETIGSFEEEKNIGKFTQKPKRKWSSIYH